jgi:tRNA(Ile)-lysidine synthase
MSELLKNFRRFIDAEQLFNRNQALLVAVSGGIDSVVLAHVCMAAGYDMVLAHCNFQLRGEESLRDEQFTIEFAARNQLALEIQRFDTAAYAEENKLSVQEAARVLRYAWFQALLEEKGLARILTAHHADDNVETMLMNLFKGTGIAGLRGILPLNGKLARPLLFASRAEIGEYALAHNLSYVEDSSNLSDKYSRNFVRLNLVPMVEKIIPGAAANLRSDMARYREVEMLYREAMSRKLLKLLVRKGDEVHIPVEKLRITDPLRTILFEIFSPYGFTAAQLEGIMGLMDAETGKYMLSSTHRLLKNRNWFILSPLAISEASVYVVDEGVHELPFPGGRLVMKLTDKDLHFVPPPNPQTAYLDASLIRYPLVLRKWKEGDYFYPLGMQKKKKIARFLIDQKVNRLEKEHVLVLESGGLILWVVGKRIDDRAKCKASTRQMLIIEQKMH